MGSILCYFFVFFVEAVILWQYSSSLFYARQTVKRKSAILLGLLYLALFAAAMLELNWLNMLFYLLANFLFLVSQYRIKWYTALFHSAILASVMGMCELAVYSIVGSFTPHFFIETGDFYSILIFAVSSKMMFFTVIYLLIHLQKGKHTSGQPHDKFVFLLILIPLVSIFVLHTFVTISDAFALPPVLKWMVEASSVFLLTANLLIFGINQYNQKKSAEYTQIQLLLQKEHDLAEYYEMLRLQNENQRILIHDIKKHLQSIDVLNQQQESEKISAYIKQLIHSSNLKEYSRLCDHEILNAILCRYMQQCSLQHITFHADIRSGTVHFIEDSDLTALFCNLLDNAIEAAEGIPSAFLEVTAVKRPRTPFVVITVLNSCRKSPFSEHGNLLTTSKPDAARHGFGIKSIRRIVKKYNGDMQMYYSGDTAAFHTIITLKEQAITHQ